MCLFVCDAINAPHDERPNRGGRRQKKPRRWKHLDSTTSTLRRFDERLCRADASTICFARFTINVDTNRCGVAPQTHRARMIITINRASETRTDATCGVRRAQSHIIIARLCSHFVLGVCAELFFQPFFPEHTHTP